MIGRQAMAFGILCFTLVICIWARWRYHLVAIFALLAVELGHLAVQVE
jgi:hypothetical protein